MTDAPTTIAAQPPTIPWWKKNWKVLVVASVVVAAFIVMRPRGDHARARAYAVMNRQGVSLALIDGKLENAKFELAPGVDSSNGNLGWAFHQLSRFPEVTHVETKWLLSVNLSALRSLTNLETFVTERAEIEDDDLAVFGGMRELKNLTLGGEKITPRGLKHLEGLPKLKSLRLSGPKIIGAGFESLDRIPNLESLSIEGGRGEWKEPLRLGAPSKLKILRLANIDLRHGNIESLNQIQSLEELSLWNVALDRAFIRQLKDLPRLKVLKIRSAGDPLDDYADVIASLPALETLHLSDGGNSGESKWATGQSMEKLARSRSIEEVSLFGVNVGNQGVCAIAKLPGLKRLRIYDVGMTDSVLPFLSEVPTIEEISLYSPALMPGMRPTGPLVEMRERLAKKKIQLTFTPGWGGGIW
jgi:hypothetical protein